VEHTGIKYRRAWTKEEVREVIRCYMYCIQHLTENRFNTETNDISTMNSNSIIAATLVFLRDIVCLRNISINTLHKGDDDDNNNNNNNNNK